MPPRRPLPRALLRSGFALEDADRLGVPRGRLFRDDVYRPHRGVRSLVDAEDVEERCRAYLPLMRDDRCFSHLTAAQLHGLPLPAALEADRMLHVTVLAPGQPPRARGIVGHRTSDRPGLRTRLRGIPVTTPEETWCALGSLLALDDLVVAGDHLVRKPLQDPADRLAALRETVERVRRRESGLLRLALHDVRIGVRSAMESRLRLVLVRAGLPEPEVNATVRDDAGGWLGEGDLVYRSARLVIEYEGERHRTDARLWASDIRRRERFEDAGWTVLRVTSDDLLRHRSELLARVRRRLGPFEG